MVELSQVKIWKFKFLNLTSFPQTWCENVNHVFKKSTSGLSFSSQYLNTEQEERQKDSADY